jgi:Gamma tubulin complex component N-terminal
MLHEILFALLGKVGTVIIEADGYFRVNPSLEFISTPEAILIEKLVVLGTYYNKLRQILQEDKKSFNDNILNYNRKEEEKQFVLSSIGNSAYVRAVCDGIHLFIVEYEKTVLEIEQDYLKDKIFTFSNLSVKLSKFYSIFPEACLMFERMDEESIKGGQLIDFLYQCSLNGNVNIKSMYSMLLNKCYSVLYNQTMLWILHGKLFDKFDEYFI